MAEATWYTLGAFGLVLLLWATYRDSWSRRFDLRVLWPQFKAQADDRALRRIAPERLGMLLELSRQVGLDRARPAAVARVREVAADR